MTSRAAFLDRDGVIVRDEGTFLRAPRFEILPGVPEALRDVRNAGYRVIVVTNQPIVARGLATEDDVRAAHRELARALAEAEAGASVDAFLFCPHHPSADVARYRVACDCRKPRPGLLLEAARAHRIELTRSVMVGDRISDVAAGQRAGCKSALVTSGAHRAPPIETPDSISDVTPDAVAPDLGAALRALGCYR